LLSSSPLFFPLPHARAYQAKVSPVMEVDVWMGCVLDVEDVRKRLEDTDKEIQQLKEGRRLIENAWAHFTLMHREDIAGVLDIASRMVEKELEQLEKVKRVFEEVLE